MSYVIASDSITGLRQENQDRCATFQFKGVGVMIICDGNGGNGGAIIAEYAINCLKGSAIQKLADCRYVSLKKLQNIGESSINHTADSVNSFKKSCPALASCGTTVTMVFIYRNTVITFWVGDSPAMVNKDSQIINLIDSPHTLAEKLIAEGQSPESVEQQSGISSILTRCIGFADATPSMSMRKFQAPFLVIAASDGINTVPEVVLKDIFSQIYLTECLPGKIIHTAFEHGSTDNITVAVAKAKAGIDSK